MKYLDSETVKPVKEVIFNVILETESKVLRANLFNLSQMCIYIKENRYSEFSFSIYE